MMGSNNTKTPSSFSTGHRKPTATQTVVGTIEAPRGHDIGPSHTAQVTALNNKVQFEKTTCGAIEGHIKIQEKQKVFLCLKVQRLDRQLQRARHEHDLQLLKQYTMQQEMQVKHAEDQLYERHGVEYLDTSIRTNSSGNKRRIVEVDTPKAGRSPSPAKAPRRSNGDAEGLRSSSNGSKTSSSHASSSPPGKTSKPEMVDLSDTTDDEL